VAFANIMYDVPDVSNVMDAKFVIITNNEMFVKYATHRDI